VGGHAVRGSTYCRRRWDYCHLRLDVIAIGGATAARRVQTLAVERAIAVSFHVYTEVSVHLATTQPGTFDQDCPGRQPARPGTPPAHQAAERRRRPRDRTRQTRSRVRPGLVALPLTVERVSEWGLVP